LIPGFIRSLWEIIKKLFHTSSSIFLFIQVGKLLAVVSLYKIGFMMQRLLIALQALVISLFVLIACTKRSGTAEQLNGPFIDLIKRFPPDPMASDSLELDSLRRLQFQ
jgi:hypothetical protein